MCTLIQFHPIVGGSGEIANKEGAHVVIITNMVTTSTDCYVIDIHSRTGIPSAKKVSSVF